jgi:hypothetical protein
MGKVLPVTFMPSRGGRQRERRKEGGRKESGREKGWEERREIDR